MQINKFAAVMLLSTLPLFSLPSLAAEQAQTKQATTTAAARESDNLNINTATLAELTTLKGIGEKKAQAILEHREKQGKFTSVEQLADVTGIGPATLEANRDMVIVK